MKKIFLLSTLIVFGVINCRAQLVHTSDFVKIELPKGIYKLSKQQVDAIPKYKVYGRPNQSYAPPYLYQMEDVSLGLFNVNTSAVNNDLPRHKSFQDNSYLFLKRNGNNTYSSSIKSMGKNQVLIINYNINEKGHYRFYYQNEAKTLTQAGKIDYNTADQAKAEALLNDVLNNIRFTK
jgi:hypothetical protein